MFNGLKDGSLIGMKSETKDSEKPLMSGLNYGIEYEGYNSKLNTCIAELHYYNPIPNSLGVDLIIDTTRQQLLAYWDWDQKQGGTPQTNFNQTTLDNFTSYKNSLGL